MSDWPHGWIRTPIYGGDDSNAQTGVRWTRMSDYTPEQFENAQGLARACRCGLWAEMFGQAARDARALAAAREVLTDVGAELRPPVSEADVTGGMVEAVRERAERAEAALAGIRAWLEHEKAMLWASTVVPRGRVAMVDLMLAELDRLTQDRSTPRIGRIERQ